MNPTHIIAEGMREIATTGAREDGQLWGAFPNTWTMTDLAAHVVSKLTDAGYSIVPNGDVTRRYSAAYRNSDGKVVPVGVDYRKRAWAEEVRDEWKRDDPNLDVFIAYRDEPEWQEADQ